MAKYRMSARRRISIASYKPPHEGVIHAAMTLDCSNVVAYLADVRERTGKKVTITAFMGAIVGRALRAAAQGPYVQEHAVRDRPDYRGDGGRSGFRRGGACADNLTTRKHHLQPQHIVAHRAIAHRCGARGAGGGHAGTTEQDRELLDGRAPRALPGASGRAGADLGRQRRQ